METTVGPARYGVKALQGPIRRQSAGPPWLIILNLLSFIQRSSHSLVQHAISVSAFDLYVPVRRDGAGRQPGFIIASQRTVTASTSVLPRAKMRRPPPCRSRDFAQALSYRRSIRMRYRIVPKAPAATQPFRLQRIRRHHLRAEAVPARQAAAHQRPETT